MTDRKEYRLGDICDLNWGDTKTTKKSYTEAGFPAYSATGQDGFLPYHDFDHTGVVVSAIGANCGRTWLAHGKWSCIKNTIRFWSTSLEADTEYLYWITHNPDFWPKRGSAQPFISQADARAASVALPPIEEQEAVAGLLGTLNDKIELNRRMNETLEAMARAIFKDWFVDFGPTRAKAEGRAPYLAPALWDLFPATLDDEDKPAGWSMRTVEDFLELAYGKSLPAKKRMPGNVAVYGSGGLSGTHNTALIEGPAVIVGRKGTVGSLYWEDGPAFPIDTVFYVIPRFGSMLFNYHLLASQPLSDMNTDAAVPGLNRGNAYRLEFPLPEPSLASAFDEIAGPLWQRRTKNLKEIETLAQTRDLLLPKLLSGEIRLGGAGKALEARL
ncbi:MAG: restriction endonuclease subunit S [Rhodospirillales bacterium]|nr:restriction endonuclease subunit S [Rhodospirillales bacterium]